MGKPVNIKRVLLSSAIGGVSAAIIVRLADLSDSCVGPLAAILAVFALIVLIGWEEANKNKDEEAP